MADERVFDEFMTDHGPNYVIAWNLNRIATALETLAADATERRQQAQASLVSQLRHLETEAERTWERFGNVDNRLVNMVSTDPQRLTTQGYANRLEKAGESAQSALDAFKAAHPEIVAQAEAVTR